ncbi:MAG TPA: OmpA family protein [Baekduia sp.]|nr:OmpA family protein [Baekduia sp.]
MLSSASAALASHQKGGFLSTSITADGHLRGTLVYLERGSCTVGNPGPGQTLQVTAPDSSTQSVSVATGYVQCLPDLTVQRGTFDVDLATWGGQQAGSYLTVFDSCCRVSGIVNSPTNDATHFESKVRSIAGTATGAPNLDSNVATGIGVGYEYRQNLNASDPDGGALTYTSQAATSSGPDYDVVTFEPDGDVVIPAATTATMADRANYVYKVRVEDAQGDYAERDVLLTATTANHPPVISGLPSGEILVPPGTTQTLVFTATDPDAGDTVTLSPSSLPSWVTFTQTPGNPALATLTISPPAGTADQAVGLNLDATDDNGAVLTASANLRITVGTPPDTTAPGAPSIAGHPASPTSSRDATFTFTGEDGGRFECRLDGGAWAPCTSPAAFPGLADGDHTFAVRQVDDAGNVGEPASSGFTVDATPPAAPAITEGPGASTTATAVTLRFAGEPGGSFECRLDGGAWAPCAGSVAYQGLTLGRHVVAIRQIDAAGNAGAEAQRAFEVGAPDPVAAPKAVTAEVAAKATVQRGSVAVGCTLDHGTLDHCVVRAYAVVRGKDGRLHRVVIGHGVAQGAAGQPGRQVQVKLNRRGRALLRRRTGGVAVTLSTAATAHETGAVLHASTSARMLPAQQLIVPSDGLFGFDSARLTRDGRRYVRQLRGQLHAAKAITCTGHTDALGPEAYNDALGLRRARTVCRALTRGRAMRGVRIAARSAGETHPRASNATEAGRALNRRVAVRVRYR